MRHFLDVAQPPSAVPVLFAAFRAEGGCATRSHLSRSCCSAATRSRPKQASNNENPAVRNVRPKPRNIDYAVDQPGFVDAYEQTSIYSKVSGFIPAFS